MKTIFLLAGVLLLVVVMSTPSEGIRICRKSIESNESNSPQSRESCEEVTIENGPRTPRPLVVLDSGRPPTELEKQLLHALGKA